MQHDYLSAFFYVDNELQHFAHEEGRVLKQGNIFRYEYNLTDHLGNVRISFADVDEDGSIDETMEVLTSQSFYPFGLRHGGTFAQSGVANRYRYNGKELNDELGLNWYDYGARMYDPSIARWNGVDPLAETSRLQWPMYIAGDASNNDGNGDGGDGDDPGLRLEGYFNTFVFGERTIPSVGGTSLRLKMPLAGFNGSISAGQKEGLSFIPSFSEINAKDAYLSFGVRPLLEFRVYPLQEFAAFRLLILEPRIPVGNPTFSKIQYDLGFKTNGNFHLGARYVAAATASKGIGVKAPIDPGVEANAGVRVTGNVYSIWNGIKDTASGFWNGLTRAASDFNRNGYRYFRWSF